MVEIEWSDIENLVWFKCQTLKKNVCPALFIPYIIHRILDLEFYEEIWVLTCSRWSGISTPGMQ